MDKQLSGCVTGPTKVRSTRWLQPTSPNPNRGGGGEITGHTPTRTDTRLAIPGPFGGGPTSRRCHSTPSRHTETGPPPPSRVEQQKEAFTVDADEFQDHLSLWSNSVRVEKLTLSSGCRWSCAAGPTPRQTHKIPSGVAHPTASLRRDVCSRCPGLRIQLRSGNSFTPGAGRFPDRHPPRRLSFVGVIEVSSHHASGRGRIALAGLCHEVIALPG